MVNTKTKSSSKRSTAKTSSDAESSAAKSKSPERRPSQRRRPNAKPPDDSSKKPLDRTPKKSSKNSGTKSDNATEPDVAESAKIDPPPPEIAEPDETMSAEEIEQARKRYLLKRFWMSARGFWGKSGYRIAWIATIGLFLLIVVNVAVQYGINVWNREIFDAIEKRDSAVVLWLSAVFFPLAFASIGLGVTEVFARMGIQRRWRAWLTDNVLSRWLSNGRYYQLNLVCRLLLEKKKKKTT